MRKGNGVAGALPSIWVSLRPSLYQSLFSSESDQLLRSLGEITFHDREQNLSVQELVERIGHYDVIITGWGAPKFTGEVLNAAGRLRLIAHSAGSIKAMLPPPVFAHNIAVTHAAVAIAPAVAEMTLALILTSLRNIPRLDRWMKEGGAWAEGVTLGMGQELAGARVGVIGAGYTGRCVIRLLTALDAEVWVYDPYLTAEQASALGVRKTALDVLLAQCPIITMQAPPTAETHHMIAARELAMLQDGALFINTARSHLVDQEALLAVLRTGRIRAALDVFDQEPLPPDHPFRQLDNVLLTPHVAGASIQARLRQGRTVVEEIQRFLAGQPLRYGVTAEMLATMA
jgi:phosphoglycerate dehydrogenase-like enzyme